MMSTRTYARYAALLAVHIEGRAYREGLTGRDLCHLARLPYEDIWSGAQHLLRERDADRPYWWVAKGHGHHYYDKRAEIAERRASAALVAHSFSGFRRSLRYRAQELMERLPESAPGNHWWLVAMQYNTLLARLACDDGIEWWDARPVAVRNAAVRDFVLLRTLDDHLRDGRIEAPGGLSRAATASPVSRHT